MHPYLSIAIVVVLLGAVMGFASLAIKRAWIGAEMARKVVHVGMGFVCLFFPWLFDESPPVLWLAAVAVLVLLVVRLPVLRSGIGAALFSVERISIGEVLFPLAVAWLFTMSAGREEVYVVSLLLLTLADTVGALAGTRWGQKIYHTAAGRKSVEGSIAFFLTALVCVCLPLACMTDLTWQKLIVLAAVVSLFAMAVEGASGQGWDNLLLPVGSFLLLDYYLDLSGSALLWRAAVLVGLAVLLLATHRLHKFNGGAILVAMLFGFAALTLGGWWCLTALMVVFCRHLIVRSRPEYGDELRHSIDAILSLALPSLLWLSVAKVGWVSLLTGQLGFLTTMAVSQGMIHVGTRRSGAGYSALKVLVLALIVWLPAWMLGSDWKLSLLVMATAQVSAWLYSCWIRGKEETDLVGWMKLSALAGMFSFLAICVWLVCF